MRAPGVELHVLDQAARGVERRRRRGLEVGAERVVEVDQVGLVVVARVDGSPVDRERGARGVVAADRVRRVVVVRRERHEPDRVDVRVHDPEQGLHAVLRVVEVGALPAGTRGRAHRPGAVDDEHDVDRRRGTWLTGRGDALDVEVVEAEHVREPGGCRRRLRDCDRVRLEGLAGSAPVRRARRAAGRDRDVDVVQVVRSVQRCVLRGATRRGRDVGKLLRAGEGGRVGRRLHLALGVPGEADVHHDRGGPEKRDQRHDHQREGLTPFVSSSYAHGSPHR